MNADLIQYAFYAGFAILGWWLRHQGLLAPRNGAPAPSAPAPASGSVDQKVVIDLLKSLLDRLTTPPATPTTAPAPGQPTGHVITVPFEVAATPRVSP